MKFRILILSTILALPTLAMASKNFTIINHVNPLYLVFNQGPPNSQIPKGKHLRLPLPSELSTPIWVDEGGKHVSSFPLLALFSNTSCTTKEYCQLSVAYTPDYSENATRPIKVCITGETKNNQKKTYDLVGKLNTLEPLEAMKDITITINYPS